MVLALLSVPERIPPLVTVRTSVALMKFTLMAALFMVSELIT